MKLLWDDKMMIKSFFTLLLLFTLSSCSLNDSSSDNPEVREVLIGVSNHYLINVINGNFTELNSVILWEDYVANKGGTFSKNEYLKQLSLLDGHYTIDNHPLLNLEPKKIKISGNYADLSFKNKNSDQIELYYTWAESGWLLSNDNLFGEDGLFAKLKPLSDKQKNKAGRIRQKKLGLKEKK